MIERVQEAEALFQRYLDAQRAPPNDRFVVVREATMEQPYGWVFFYDSEVHRTTGNPLHMLGGNAPVLIERTGRVVPFGTHQPVEWFLAEYEAGRWTVEWKEPKR